MSKVIVHIDLNAFFVRCEELKNPDLIDKAVAIGHDGRKGIVSTCSYKAREFGVRSGMPMFQAKQLCPQLIVKPVDFRFYSVLSSDFFKFVRQYTKIVENASVDECFADFTNAIKGIKDVPKYFRDFQKALFEKTGLYCSIGIGTTKFLAKMGSDYKKPNGLTIIRKRDIKKILYPLSIKDMYGIGKKTRPRLESVGVFTIGDLAQKVNSDDPIIKDILGKFFYTVKQWLNGEGDDVINSEPSDPKSIGHSTTLSSDTENYDEIKNAFELLSRRVSQRAIEDNKVGTTIQIVIKEPAPSFKSFNKSITLNIPTNDHDIIFDKAMKLYEANFLGKVVRLVGVTLQNLISPNEMVVQMSLFDCDEYIKESETSLLISKLNKKLKKNVLTTAASLERKKK